METVKRLLRAGADMDIKNNAGITPMDLLMRVERQIRDDIAEGAPAREVPCARSSVYTLSNVLQRGLSC